MTDVVSEVHAAARPPPAARLAATLGCNYFLLPTRWDYRLKYNGYSLWYITLPNGELTNYSTLLCVGLILAPCGHNPVTGSLPVVEAAGGQ